MTEEEENKCLTGYKKLFCANCEADCTISILGCNEYQFFFKGYEQGYEDCRHYAHDYYKPKWHDLRKNPNDLPKNSGLYCVQCGEVREYVKEEKSWFTVHFDPCRNCTEDTYLWCELPKFKE